MADWRRALLKALGVPITQANITFLTTWQRWEGGHTNNDARWNWLNTTDGPGRSINSVGVKAFPNFQTGIRSLAGTLNNGRYGDILQALASGDPYKVKPTAGLETWVSGSPTGNPGYAQKILGGYSGGAAPTLAHDHVPTSLQDAGFRPNAGGFDPHGDIARVLFGKSDPSFLQLMNMFASKQPAIIGANQHPHMPTQVKGAINIPEHWRGTHVTDGLGWGTKTAHDFMGAPGTAVRMPEDVKVVYYHPEGAQGGGSMLLQSSSGRVFWIGHIASSHKAGDHIRAGTPVAVIANQHVSAPHVHVDSRGG